MDITQLTIAYMTNTKIRNKNLETNASVSIDDLTFYKHRLFKLTNQLLNSDHPPDVLQDVLSTYNTYIKSCVEYFKSVDRCDMIQKDHIPEQSHIDDVITSDESISNSYRYNIKPVHYDMTKFVTRTRPGYSPTPPPRTKELDMESEDLRYKDCGPDSNILINQSEIDEHGIDIVLPYSYFAPLDEK
jgi:hypothetical protein